MDVLAVTGPTASGKSDLALSLALAFDGEILSADSMQIYRGMDIGTAKPDSKQRAAIPHHLIDILSPGESFSVAEYVNCADKAVRDIIGRGKLPVICGGTGLYIDSLVWGVDFGRHESDPEYRAALEKMANDRGGAHLHAMLVSVDPEEAAKVHENNIKRVIRALELCHITGGKKSELDKQSKGKTKKYNELRLELCFSERQRLYERIERRTQAMLESGWLEEALNLDKAGLREGVIKTGAIGYNELFSVIDGITSVNQAAESIKASTRAYAKRQITWFKRNIDSCRINADAPFEEIYAAAAEIIRNSRLS